VTTRVVAKFITRRGYCRNHTLSCCEVTALGYSAITRPAQSTAFAALITGTIPSSGWVASGGRSAPDRDDCAVASGSFQSTLHRLGSPAISTNKSVMNRAVSEGASMRFWMIVFFLACSLSQNAAGQAKSGLIPDIEYGSIDGVRLTLDAFVPEGEGPFPACILVHGGGYIAGDKTRDIEPLFEPLGKAKFAWFSINYRLAPDHRWPACAEDVETAILWLKEHAGEYKVDPTRIALIGESAGGHLVSYVGARAVGPTSIAAVVPFYAPHDLEFQVRHRNLLGESLSALFGVKELNDEVYEKLRDASASTVAEPQMPPYLLIHGDKDTGVPYEHSVRFQKQLKRLGNPCDLVTVSGGNHGMVGWNRLKSDYREQLVAWLERILGKDDPAPVWQRLERHGAKFTKNGDLMTQLAIANCEKLGLAEYGLIGQLTDLKGISLGGQCSGLTDKTLKQLSSLPNLEEILTNGIQVTDDGFSEFGRITSLKVISFMHPSSKVKGFNGRGLAALKAIPELRHISIAGCALDDRGMEAISEITQLRELRVWHTYQTQKGNEFLVNLSNLRSLRLGQRLRKSGMGNNPVSLNDKTLEILSQIKSLEVLTLSQARFSAAAISNLKDLPNLKRLELLNIEIPDASVEDLNALLPNVKVTWRPMTDQERTSLATILKE
jgi:acetyl esterase